MQIWLPPSEGKNSPKTGAPLKLHALSFPELHSQRQQVLSSLIKLSDAPDAATILGLGSRSAHDLEINKNLLSSPTAAMEDVFAGVLFHAAQLQDCDHAAQKRAQDSLRVFSGLFGVLRFGDAIPDHRLAMNVSLPDLGPLKTFWKPFLDEALRSDTAKDDVIIDMRSGPYRAACPAPWATLWQIGVVRESNGKRSAISHDAKRWRGLITGFLLRRGPLPMSTSEARCALEEAQDLPPIMDARGGQHRITGVEFGHAQAKREGGSTTLVTLVTD